MGAEQPNVGRPVHGPAKLAPSASSRRSRFVDNVSVVVLTYNKPEMTAQCLQAIRRDPTELLREVVIVDNGSRPENVAPLRALVGERTRLIEVGANRFFGEGNNIGAETATGEYVVFLNNDAFVERGWLDEMARAMEEDERVAAVGPMLLYPDGRVQEVGALVLPNGDAVQVGKGAAWNADHYTDICEVDYCSAACLLVRKSDFLKVGGFSYQYEPAFYEDSDLCLKLWTSVGKVVVNPLARVVHVENQTTSDPSLGLYKIVELNREKFLGEWGEWLARRAVRETVLDPHRAPGPDRHHVSTPQLCSGPAASPARSARPIVAAVYTPYELVPGGGERFVFELLAHLSSSLGADRTGILTPHPYSAVRVHQIGREFGFDELVATPSNLDAVDPGSMELGIVVGNAIAPPIPAFARRNVYHCQFPFFVPDEYIAEHGPMLGGFDEIWVNSEFTRRYTLGIAGAYGLECPPVRIVHPPASWPGADPGIPWTQRRTILSVGRFFAEGHNKRQDVVIDVVRELVTRGRPVELALAGSVHTVAESRQRFAELVAMADGLPVRFHPNAGRRRLAELYASSSVLVHATGYGLDPIEHPERLEHFGIAPIEAASFGCIPVVYGEAGPAEVVAILGAGRTFHPIGECADQICDLLDHPDASSALSETVRSRSEIFSSEAFRKRVSEALVSLGVPGPW